MSFTVEQWDMEDVRRQASERIWRLIGSDTTEIAEPVRFDIYDTPNLPNGSFSPFDVFGLDEASVDEPDADNLPYIDMDGIAVTTTDLLTADYMMSMTSGSDSWSAYDLDDGFIYTTFRAASDEMGLFSVALVEHKSKAFQQVWNYFLDEYVSNAVLPTTLGGELLNVDNPAMYRDIARSAISGGVATAFGDHLYGTVPWYGSSEARSLRDYAGRQPWWFTSSSTPDPAPSPAFSEESLDDINRYWHTAVDGAVPPGLDEARKESTNFNSWARTTSVRWRDSGRVLTEYDVRLLRLVCQFLAVALYR